MDNFYTDPAEIGKRQKKGQACPICGKPPDCKTICPNCKIENICEHHLYRFYGENNKSPIGCAKCGPRCAMCGTQTTLKLYNKRAVCSLCLQTLAVSEKVKEQRQRETAGKIKNWITTAFTFIGLGTGAYLGMQPSFQKLFLKTLQIKSMPEPLILLVVCFIGLITGSFIAGILSSFIKSE